MKIMISAVLATLIMMLFSCSTRVLVKDCNDIDSDIKDCLLIRKL